MKRSLTKCAIKISLSEKDYTGLQLSIDGGMSSKEALSKLKLSQSPTTGQEKCQYLISDGWQRNMSTF